jgi:sugar/nucleoside kinase (ribokinase family)
MRSRGREFGPGERGTASIELLGTLPFLVLAVLVAAQIAVGGASLWAAAISARAGARAALVGRSGSRAARSALPAALRSDAEVEERGPVSVAVPVPRLLPAMPSLRVSARSGLGEGG